MQYMFMSQSGIAPAIHGAAVLAFITGIVLFCVYAAKTFSPRQLVTWSLSLLVLGTVACLLVLASGTAPMRYGSDASMMKCDMMQGGGMGNGMMMDGDRDDDDPMAMSMDDMGAMLEGKTGDAFDKAFVEAMIPHHQGAIEMARAALRSAKHDEIKRMANDIITAQQREIDQMQQWLRDWGFAK